MGIAEAYECKVMKKSPCHKGNQNPDIRGHFLFTNKKAAAYSQGQIKNYRKYCKRKGNVVKKKYRKMQIYKGDYCQNCKNSGAVAELCIFIKYKEGYCKACKEKTDVAQGKNSAGIGQKSCKQIS